MWSRLPRRQTPSAHFIPVEPPTPPQKRVHTPSDACTHIHTPAHASQCVHPAPSAPFVWHEPDAPIHMHHHASQLAALAAPAPAPSAALNPTPSDSPQTPIQLSNQPPRTRTTQYIHFQLHPHTSTPPHTVIPEFSACTLGAPCVARARHPPSHALSCSSQTGALAAQVPPPNAPPSPVPLPT